MKDDDTTVETAEDTLTPPADDGQVVFDQNEADALEQGFNDALALDKIPAETPRDFESQAEPKPAVEPAAKEPEKEPEKDPIEARMRTMAGRIGSLNDQVATLVKALQEQQKKAESPPPVPTTTQVAAANTGEKWKKLQADFPEWAEATMEYIESQRQSTPDLSAVLASSKDELAEEVVSAVLPDWEWQQSVKLPEFADWLAAQEQSIKEAARKPGAVPTLRVLRAYQKSAAAKSDPYLNPDVASDSEAENNTNTALEAAAMVKTNSRPRREPSRTELDDLEEGFKRG